MSGKIHRARGCLLGQFSGDSLGGLVEFESAAGIRRIYPNGVRNMADGGTWNTIAGQVTDDSEMALAMARTLVDGGRYDVDSVRQAYVDWMMSGPFDIGMTTMGGLRGRPDQGSQANGALMRASPLGIFCAGLDLDEVSNLAALDAAITHPNPVCVHVNQLYVMAIAHAIEHGVSAVDLYRKVVQWAEAGSDTRLVEVVKAAAVRRPSGYEGRQQGWVLIAFQNACGSWSTRHRWKRPSLTPSCRAAIPIRTPAYVAPCLAPFTASQRFRNGGLHPCWHAVRKLASLGCAVRVRCDGGQFARNSVMRA